MQYNYVFCIRSFSRCKIHEINAVIYTLFLIGTLKYLLTVIIVVNPMLLTIYLR